LVSSGARPVEVSEKDRDAAVFAAVIIAIFFLFVIVMSGA
jgi:hypothetical protein